MAAAVELPSPNDYLSAVQNPRNCFADAALAAGETLMTPLGLPKVASGNFAVVFQVKTSQSRYAVKCFTRRGDGQERRYAAIARHIRAKRLPYFVDFAYQPQGIRVGGVQHPIVKMEWATGKLLHLFVEENLRHSGALSDVAQEWRRLVADLRRARIDHGDLQHRNVVVQVRQIRLIDYDGIYVPALQGEPGTEAGHEHFQHPMRRTEDFGVWRDSFASLVIYVSLRALAADFSLWKEFHLGENLIFSKIDYQRAGQTRIWGRLAQSSDEEVRRLALLLQSFCRLPIRQVPSLEEVLARPALTLTRAPVRQAPVGQPQAPVTPPVDYQRLGEALGVRPGSMQSGSPAQTPSKERSGAPRRPIDWEQLRRIEESQRRAAILKSLPSQRPEQASSQLPAQPASQQTAAMNALPTARLPSSRAGLESRRVLDNLMGLSLDLPRLIRTLLDVAMVVVVVTSLLLVGLYFAAGWLAEYSPTLAEWLSPLLRTLRDSVELIAPPANRPPPAIGGR